MKIKRDQSPSPSNVSMVTEQKKTKKWPVLCLADTAVMLCITVVLTVLLATTKLVPTLYLVAVAVVGLLLTGAVFLLTREAKGTKRRVAGTVLTALVLVVALVGGYYLVQTVNAVRRVANAAVERSAISFYALQDSTAESLEDMAGDTFGILANLDRANTDEALQQVQEEHDLTLTTVEYDDLMSLADALLDGSVDGIVLNEAYLDIYEETSGYEEFPDQLKQISTKQVEHVVETNQEEGDHIINILISGSDTRSEVLDQRGRSDVNVIASINTETHQVLLISTPRDYFVPLDIGVSDAYDKLTHAGIYGMDVLMGTLENLYGIELDYYFRLNFTGFVDIIDALGGVEVYSKYTFSARGYDFVEGMNTMDGAAALAFARERYSFAEGDRQRGANQMAVIEAVFQKALSPSVLNNYLSILNSVQNCIDTSVPYDVLADLVRQQLESGASWTIESFSVNGSDAHSTTYSMNQELYVMIPDESTVQEAKDKLAAMGNEVDGVESDTTAAESQPAA